MSKSKKSKAKAVKKRRQQMKKAKAAAPNIIIPGLKSSGFMDHVWAEKGVIKTRGKDGIVKTMTLEDAAWRAKQLNDAVKVIPHVSTKKAFLEVIERVTKAVREAKRQRETPDKKTEGLHNLLAGKNEDGTAPKLGRIEDYLIDDYIKQYPMLSEDELMKVLRSDNIWPTLKEKETVLRTINTERLRVQQGSPDGGLAGDLISEASR